MNRTTLLFAVVLGICSSTVYAQAYPNKPIKLVVGFAPGGAADYVARNISIPLGQALGQSIVIENKPGAGSSIAAEQVAKSAPDGYTILIASPSSISVNPALSPKLGYKPSDFQPITKITSSPVVIAVNPNTGINSIKELITKAKQNPGALNYATSGNGSAPHLAAALFSQEADVKMTHIPFRGGSLAIQSVIAGDTQLTFGTPPSVLPMIQAGRLKGLAISAKERSPLAPSLPGMREAGLPDYAIEFWYGLFVPVGTPPAIVQKIFDAAQTALKQPNVKAALEREGTDVSLSTSPAQFVRFLAEDEKFWIKLVKSAEVTVD
ncbi:tripartite tricarboxylate transporter substrate binding protein [Polynucleobacter sp. 15G-AUS-farblos]|uniref:Bug family tripartite tricarboxylate transporter substrate binding protein n=1 Tax=Polynucleobacter sp. 15G-AUS-farblos TaxID=2689094 RepID=UPI001C0AC8C1|nr:tripartite tricarboxylate transporter substrate binding protein [Polynucleobacter sp. 15G-AUS-farblos]MBU3584211.1 tripartite tricarboxylate transporter substrate binding protein [Polynucleobacter sp. 15G-AUS-farblos]